MKTENWKIKRLWYLLKYVGTIITLLAVAGVLLVRGGCEIAGRIVITLDILLVAWMVMTVFDKVLRNKWVFMSLFVLILSLGIYVYSGQVGLEQERYQIGEVDDWVSYLYAIDNALSVFFLSFGNYFLQYSTNVWYFVFNFLGYFFAANVLFSLFGKKMVSRTLCWVISREKKCVFWGYSVAGKVLAKDILRQKEFCQPVFVLSKTPDYDKETDSRIFDELTDFGAIVVYEDIHNELWVKGKRHMFMTDNQDENVNGALRLIEHIKECLPHQKSKTYIHVCTDIEGIDAMFQAQLKENAELKASVEMSIYSQSDLIARSFVMKHPILDLAGREFKPEGRRLVINPEKATVNGECNVLLLGLGWSGYELLRKTVCDAQFIGENYRFTVTVIDEGYERERGRYQRVFEMAKSVGIEIKVNPVATVNSGEFYRWLSEGDNILNYDRIIVAMGDDALNTETAMQLHKFRLSRLTAYNAMEEKNMPESIFVQVKDYRSFSFYKKSGSPIVPFGDFEEINSVDVLIREKMDRVAKLVNYIYTKYDCKELTEDQMRDKEAVDKAWDGIDTNLFSQNSSRSVALTVRNTVRIGGGIESFREKVRDPFFLECYSRMEHLRWNAFHVMSGVEVWKREDVSNKKGKLLFEGTLARHICIVEYDELDEVTEFVRSLGNVNEDYKESDRRIVRHFPVFYDIMNGE